VSISKGAYDTFVEMHRQYVEDEGGGVVKFGFKDAPPKEARQAMRELEDFGLIQRIGTGPGHSWTLTPQGRRGPRALGLSAPAVHIGDNINITDSTVAAFATRGSTATGTVTDSNTMGQSDVRAAVGDLQAVLDKMEDLDQKTYDFMSEILLKLRKAQIEAGPKETVLAQLKEKLDDESVREEVAKMKPSLARLGTSVAQAAKHPLAPDVLALVVALADKVT
jgi:hypothetical protein